jgi:hypothetical protein
MRKVATILLASLFTSIATVAWGEEPSKTIQAQVMSADDMSRHMADWPKASRDAAAFMVGKYGPPAAMTSELVVWNKTGPWKRTIIYKKEMPHDFPMAHTDVMQQWIDYKAPVDKYDELATYDGSVVLERTSGEMSARCDKEGANFLALNLANEVATGKMTVAEARTKYGEQIKAMMEKKPAPLTEKLMVPAMTSTGDKDKPVNQ